MTIERIRVLVLFGGRSSEHEVSCLSARNVLAAIDRGRYDVTTVGITREGRWTLVDGVAEAAEGTLPAVPADGQTVALVSSRKGPVLVRFDDGGEAGGGFTGLGPVDVCFPVMHGPYGEDGTVQGLLASFGVPYVGPDVAASAIGIDKRQMKHVFTARGLPQVPHTTVRRGAWEADRHAVMAEVEAALAYPMFTKPARQGSSIGICRCDDRLALTAGIEEAFGFDRVAIVEEGMEGIREIECGVMGNAEPVVTRPGETVHTGIFYDFDAKYIAPVELRCPADIPDEVSRACMEYARDAYLAIGARGMSRVDMFYVEATGQILVNEINTIPGLTSQSMFWAVWEAEGMQRPQIVDRLLDLALDAGRRGARFPP
ncbi:D-alanine--D-alanine ligase family protein [soil metagenome]